MSSIIQSGEAAVSSLTATTVTTMTAKQSVMKLVKAPQRKGRQMMKIPTVQQTHSQQVHEAGPAPVSNQQQEQVQQEGQVEQGHPWGNLRRPHLRQIEQGPLLGRLSHPGLHRGAEQAQRGQVARQGLRPEWSSQTRSRQVGRVSQERTSILRQEQAILSLAIYAPRVPGRRLE